VLMGGGCAAAGLLIADARASESVQLAAFAVAALPLAIDFLRPAGRGRAASARAKRQ